MPQFTNALPAQTSSIPFDLKRTPPTGQLTGIITSHEITAVRTHFAHNRTRPCELPDHCVLCEEGHAWRSHVYVTVMDFATYEHFILELTAKAATTLVTYHGYHRTLRGCAIRCTRISQTPNGRINVQTKRANDTHQQLPDPPNVQKLLCHIWNIPYVPPQATPIAQLFKLQEIAQDPNGNGKRKPAGSRQPK